MKELTLQEISEACRGTLLSVQGQEQKKATGVVIDNRKLTEGDLFFALSGERTDGHRFVEKALADGAAACVVERIPEKVTGPLILVRSTRQALMDLAGWYRQILSVKVVGISGSVGKTSTKETIAAVLSEKYRVLKTEGNFNNEIGLPLTIFRLEEEHEIAVLEMGISDFGEMSRLAEVARPDIGVITNIGICHLENLKTRDGILKAKTEMFDYLAADGTAILNGGDDKLRTVREVNGKKPVFFGLKEEEKGETFDVSGGNVVPHGLKELTFSLYLPGVEVRDVTLHALGRHNVYNALCAAAVGVTLGLTPDEIAAGLAKYRTIAGRSNIIETETLTIIDDCYNANPVSMKEALSILDLAEGRKIAVLGDMGELGDGEKELHREVGSFFLTTSVNTVFLAGKLMKEFMDEIKGKTDKTAYWYETREEMTRALLDYVKPKDTVLVKASHFMEFPEIVEELKSI